MNDDTLPPTKSAPSLPITTRRRRRPDVAGHPGIERGSVGAADLFWADAALVMAAGGRSLPAFKRYGFTRDPSPTSTEAHSAFSAWQRYDREKTRESFMRASANDRAMLYWGAVDHATMFGGPAPDPYIFGYDEHPATRPPEHAEPPYVREIRDAREGGAAPSAKSATEALSFFGLQEGASAEDIGRAFRKLVTKKRLHPDQGGDAETFAKVCQRRDRALASIGSKA